MTALRREWIPTFADPAILSDLRSAIHSMMGDVDDCDPEECLHAEQLVSPIEVLHWIEREVNIARRKPLHMRPAGQPNRKRADPRLEVNLSLAG